MSKYLDLSIDKLHQLLVKGEIKPLDLVTEALDRVDKDNLNCFINVDREGAIKRAKALENNVRKDNLLWGIPIALKDNIITRDIITTAGSKMLSNFKPSYDAYVVRLIEEAGMIIIGKLNMDEFAMGSSNQTSYFGPVKNPWNEKLVPGGSSGGSAACVSSRIVPLALGSDTGGSIRQPSAFSLDQIGPITRNVYENALLLNILSKKDSCDLTQEEINDDVTRLIGEDIKGMKIAIPKFYISDVIDEEIRNKFKEICELLKSKGVILEVVDIPLLKYAVPLYQIIALGEASSNLARFDGIKYGYATSDAKDIDDFYYKTRSEGFGDEVKRRIMVGSFMLSGKNVKEYYTKALKIRKSISLEFFKVFKEFDLIIGPTTTCLPYEIGDSLDDPNKSFVDDILTIPVNMAGLPGMSLPIGFSKSNLPIGMQIIGDRFNEAIIYKLGAFLEKKLDLNLDPRRDNNE